MKKFFITLLVLNLTLSIFSIEMETIQKKIVGGYWAQKGKQYNQVFYYSFNNDNKTGNVYFTQNGKKIGEYKITYKIEDYFVIITTPGGDIIWEVAAITDSILVIKSPGGNGEAATLRRQ